MFNVKIKTLNSLVNFTWKPICRYRLIPEIFHLCSVITISFTTCQYVKSADTNSCKDGATTVKKNPVSDFQHCTKLCITVTKQCKD